MPNISTNTPAKISAIEQIKNLDEGFVAYMIFSIIVIIVICMIIYMIYMSRLQTSECNNMNTLYGSLDKYIKPIGTGADFSGNLNDYYIKTAFNACSGGNYKNDYVNICNLKSVLKQGVRGLDFEVYSVGDQPVVSTSTTSDFYVKETFNTVSFSDVMSTIKSYAFSSSNAPNSTDPIILHLRIMSNNNKMYNNMASILKSYDSYLLGKDYSYENYGHNTGRTSLIDLLGKIVIIVYRNNTTFLANSSFMEYVNLTSGSYFMRALTFYNVQYSPDIQELQTYNQKHMTIVFPDEGSNPSNPNTIVARESGCQMVAMRYQYVDNYLEENTSFFDNYGYAFRLKPAYLRYTPVTVPGPIPQDPSNSYATRDISTNYYSFNV